MSTKTARLRHDNCATHKSMAHFIDAGEIARLTAAPPRSAVRTGAAKARVRSPSRADMLCLAVGLVGFVSVWRFNLIFLKQVSFLRLGIVTLGLGIAAWLFSQNRLHRWQAIEGLKATRLVLGILVIGALGVPLGAYPGKALEFLRVDYLSLVLYFLLTVASIRSRADLERLMFLHVVGAAIYSVNALKTAVGADGRLSHLTVYDANDFGFMLVCTLPLAVYFLRTNAKPLIRLLVGLAVVVFVVQLVRTGSRGAFLGLIGVSGYLLFWFKGIPVRVRAAAVAIGLITIAAAGTDRYWEMMSTIANPSEDYNMTEKGGRVEIWKRGLGYMLRYPIAGVGFDNFGVAEGQSDLNRARAAEGRGWVQNASHNSFIQMGSEGGLIGLGLFLVLLVWSFQACSWRPPADRPPMGRDEQALGRALAGSLVGYCIAGFFVSQAYSTFLYSILGLIAGLVKVRAIEARAPSQYQKPRPTQRLPFAGAHHVPHSGAVPRPT